MKPEDKTQQVGTTTADDKNLMPSMVARQQRIHLGHGANQRSTTSSNNASKILTTGDDEPSHVNTQFLLKSAQEASQNNNNQHLRQEFDQNGLILPRRVPNHPVSVAQPIIRDLNRELKFNQIRGKNVLEQKSELKKALEKLEESKKKKEVEQDRLNRRTSLELRLEERAVRLARETDVQTGGDASTTCNPRNFSIKSTNR